MVDLEHRGTGQLGHPPGSRVEPRAEDDDLPGGVPADRLVDRDGPRHHRQPGPAHHLVCQPAGRLGGHPVGAHAIHDEAIRRVEKLPRDRVGEPAHGIPAVGGCPALADQDSRGAGGALGHAQRSTSNQTVFPEPSRSGADPHREARARTMSRPRPSSASGSAVGGERPVRVRVGDLDADGLRPGPQPHRDLATAVPDGVRDQLARQEQDVLAQVRRKRPAALADVSAHGGGRLRDLGEHPDILCGSGGAAAHLQAAVRVPRDLGWRARRRRVRGVRCGQGTRGGVRGVRVGPGTGSLRAGARSETGARLPPTTSSRATSRAMSSCRLVADVRSSSSVASASTSARLLVAVSATRSTNPSRPSRPVARSSTIPSV